MNNHYLPSQIILHDHYQVTCAELRLLDLKNVRSFNILCQQSVKINKLNLKLHTFNARTFLFEMSYAATTKPKVPAPRNFIY
jgi:hypothetical protein